MICPACQADNDRSIEVCFHCGKALSALTKGSVLASRYEIVDLLGKGGMGVVYKAHDQMLDETIAVKVLRRDLSATPEAARRFRSELKLARRVSHPNVCRIHEYGEDGELSYITMAFVEGADVKKVLEQHPKGLPTAEAFDVAIQVAHGLQAIHQVGIIHRDLKGPNIMRDSTGLVRLMDFGIAKDYDETGSLTATGVVVGTPEYMSPEQCRGDQLDARSDVYSFGVVLFELFTGQVPFRGDSLMATLLMHVQVPPPLEGPLASRIPPPLIPVLRRALAKKREDRYASAAEVAGALEVARAQPVEVAPPVEVPPPLEATGPMHTTLPVEAPPPAAPAKDRRRETRLEMPLNVRLERTDPGGAVLEEERTIAENVSRNGAQVLTAMTSVVVGDLLIFEEVGTDFRTRAAVRTKYPGKDGICRLGLEFLDRHAPDRLVATGEWKSSLAAPGASRATRTPTPQAVEAPRHEGGPPPRRRSEERRTTSRLEVPLEVVLKKVDAAGMVVQEERTMADSLSRNGARVMTALRSISIGDIVRLAEVGGDFETRATVRNAYVGNDHIGRLNLEFLDRAAPDRLVRTDDARRTASSAARGGPPPSEIGGTTGPVAAPLPPELQARRQQILDAYERLRTCNHFELLGIPRASGEAQVREGYFRQVKLFHPDTAANAALADLGHQINTLMIRLGDAYGVLTNPKRRSAYEEFLGPSRRESRPFAATPTPIPPAAGRVEARPEVHEPPAAPAPAPPAAPADPAAPAPAPAEMFTGGQASLEAAAYDIVEARKLIAQEKNWEAIQILERTLPLVQGKVKHRAQVLLARAVLRNPNWVRRAEEILQSVVQEDRDNTEAHLLLGALYKQAGLRSRAERMLHRALELDPHNKSAAAELRDLGHAPEKRTPSDPR